MWVCLFLFCLVLVNISPFGRALDRYYPGWVRSRDPTRPVHYEGGGSRTKATDVVCPMYMRVWDIVKIAKDTEESRPLILCEYSHSMGNSNGNIHKYWEAIDETHGLQGGFIWDWADQGLLKSGPGGIKHWAYGGDFGDVPNDLNFCLNGLIWPDRTAHPALQEVKHVYQPIGIMLTDNQVQVWNKHFFTSLDDVEFRWALYADGAVLGSGPLDLPILGPREKYVIPSESEPWHNLWKTSSAYELYLTITGSLSSTNSWADKGHVVASQQLRFPPAHPRHVKVLGSSDRRTRSLVLSESNDTITIESDTSDWAMIFDRDGGVLKSWKVKERGVVSSGPVPSFWRAPTDNDKGGGDNSYNSRWRAVGLDKLSVVCKTGIEICEQSTHYLELKATLSMEPIDSHQYMSDHFPSPPGEGRTGEYFWFKVGVIYKIYGTGDLVIDYEVKPNSMLPSLPRIGIEFKVDKRCSDVQWYGRGPFECYPDRKSAAHIGVYQCTVEELHVPYIVPGECGGRADVRWVGLSDREAGVGLLAMSIPDSSMQMNVSYYSTNELDAATHDEELNRSAEIQVHLDHKHMGLGGDDSWTACVHEEYTLPPISYQFSVRFQVVNSKVKSYCSDVFQSQLE